jgi:ankyrin repeat protein
MPRILPTNPSLEHLRKQAKDLLRDFERDDPAAVERLRVEGSLPGSAPPKLADALHALAHEYGFSSWPALKRQVETQNRPTDHFETLAALIKANNTAGAGALLARHPELHAMLDAPLPGYGFGGTALLAAVHCGNREMIDLLLRAGADINARSHWWAGSFGVLDDDRGLAPFLIDRGATVDVHAASRLGRQDRLQALIAADPTLVHSRGGDGQTPLHFASSIDIAGFLLDQGADIDARDLDHESTPAQWMVRDRQAVARYLVSRGCRTDLLMVAALGDLELVRRHLEADPESIRTSVSEKFFPKQDPRSGGSIYIWTLGQNKAAQVIAREFGHEDVYRFLMERSPDELKLALACEVGDESMFQALLASHPNLVRTFSEGERRKLADAAQSNTTTAVRLMLEAGWPVDVRGQHGGTPLHWAAWHGNAEMVREILRYRPPLEVGADEGYDGPPLGWAMHGSENGWHKETGDYAGTVEALLRAGAKAPELTEDLEASPAAREALRRHRESTRAER